MATRTRKMISPWRAFFEISLPQVGEKSSMLMEAVSTPAWTASDLNRRARWSPPRALTVTPFEGTPSAEARAPTTSARLTVESFRWVMSLGVIPAWSARAFFTPAAVAELGVGEGVGVAFGPLEGLAEAEGDGEADVGAEADGVAEDPADDEAGIGRVITATVPPATVTLGAGMPMVRSAFSTWLAVTLFVG